MTALNHRYIKIFLVVVLLATTMGAVYFVKNKRDEDRSTTVIIERPKGTKITDKRQTFSGTGLKRIDEKDGVVRYELTCYYRSGDKKIEAVLMGFVTSSERLPSFEGKCY